MTISIMFPSKYQLSWLVTNVSSRSSVVDGRANEAIYDCSGDLWILKAEVLHDARNELFSQQRTALLFFFDFPDADY